MSIGLNYEERERINGSASNFFVLDSNVVIGLKIRLRQSKEKKNSSSPEAATESKRLELEVLLYIVVFNQAC